MMDIVKFPMESLINIVSSLIDSMVATNNKIPNSQLTYFHSRAIPNISIASYLSRIQKFAPFTNEALLSVLIYFDRISVLNFTINSYNIHRLLITSIMVASKFTSDIYYSNNRYAKVGGISLQELNQLELELLFLINFKLHVPLEHLQEYADQLLSHSIASNIITTHPTNITYPSQQVVNRTQTNKATNLPLTPPYNPPIIKGKIHKHQHHPYLRPPVHKKLGLISPRDCNT